MRGKQERSKLSNCEPDAFTSLSDFLTLYVSRDLRDAPQLQGTANVHDSDTIDVIAVVVVKRPG